MLIKNIRIDRFGVCSDLQLDLLAESLTVFSGPTGSGKATLAGFVRAMLYGFDEGTRRRYLPTDSRGFGGVLELQSAGGRQTVSRYDDGGAEGRLTIEHENGAVLGRRHLSEAVSNLPLSTFDRIFAVDYRRRPGIGALIEEAHARGFNLLGGAADADRLSALERQIRDQRDVLATVPRVQSSPAELIERRDALRQIMADLEAALQRKMDERELAERIERLSGEVEELQYDLQRLESEQAAAKQRRAEFLAVAARDGSVLSHDTACSSSSFDELRAVNDQIAHRQSLLMEVVTRRQAAEARNEAAAGTEPGADPRRWISKIESQLVQAQRALSEMHDTESYQGGEIKTQFRETLTALRHDLYRLCNDLSRSEIAAVRRECANELSHLRRCEVELREALADLSQRKQAVQQDIAGTHNADGLATVPWLENYCGCAEHPRLQIPAAVKQPASKFDEELAQIDARLASLDQQHEKLLADIDDVEGELSQLRETRQHAARAEMLGQLDAKRSELRSVEQMLKDQQRRADLLVQIAEVEAELQRLRGTFRPSELIAEASELLRRLTAGDLRNIEVAANEQVWVTDEHGRRRAYHQLSDGGRDLVYFAISLAIVDAYRRRGLHVPMLVSGVFTNVDSKNVPAAAELLRDFAGRGQQVLLFTRYEHVAGVFRLLNVPVRSLEVISESAQRMALATTSEAATSTAPAGVNAAHAASLWDTDEYADGLTDRVQASDPAAADREAVSSSIPEFSLSEHSLIENAPSIDTANAERLRHIGILHVGDLLRLSPQDAMNELRAYGLTAETIATWQSQSRLLCRVPRLRPYDARVLVACGVTQPEQLFRLSPSDLRQMVKNLAASSHGQAVLMSGTEFELSRLTDWIGISPVQSTSAGSHQQRAPRTGSRSDSTRSRRAERAEHPSVVRLPAGGGDRRFFLQRSSAVIDAPSIGPRTAERLEQLGVKIVSDLLQADAAYVASRMGDRRFSAKLIRQWQQQAELACRVPELRSHDAQLLVALDITQPEQLAASDPQQLWSRVAAFMETKEGKRIVRNGKEPDLAEVTDWVQAARAARALHAA